MAQVCFDASAALAFALPDEPQHAQAVAIVKAFAAQGTTLCAPALFAYECNSVIRLRLWKKSLTEERYWFEKFWASLPFAFLSDSDLEAIITAVKEESPNRNTPSRVKGKIAAYKVDALKAHNVKSGKTAADLYRELEQKVLAE